MIRSACIQAAALLLFTIVGCPSNESSMSGGGLGTGGSGGSYEPACPGFESEPGAGCPAPCEPLVPGGPGGRAYCTQPCLDGCGLGMVCASSKGPDQEMSDEPDVCLPGGCDVADPRSCPDDFKCISLGSINCYPSAGTESTRCEPYRLDDTTTDCSSLCSFRLETAVGVYCTSECTQTSQQCAAGDGCWDDLGDDDYPGLCTKPCFLDTDCLEGLKCSPCPFPPCPGQSYCDYGIF